MPVQSEVSRHFACAPQAPGLVRSFVADTLREWGLDELVEDSVLVAAELATNAVVHANSDVTVSLLRRTQGVGLVVSDSNPSLPSMRTPAEHHRGGRGLLIVDAIADRWGFQRTSDGKRGWAEVGSRIRPSP